VLAPLAQPLILRTERTTVPYFSSDVTKSQTPLTNQRRGIPPFKHPPSVCPEKISFIITETYSFSLASSLPCAGRKPAGLSPGCRPNSRCRIFMKAQLIFFLPIQQLLRCSLVTDTLPSQFHVMHRYWGSTTRAMASRKHVQLSR
jgi:hypothetical protein